MMTGIITITVTFFTTVMLVMVKEGHPFEETCLFKYLNIYCMEQTFRWNKEMIPKIFEQILEQVFGRNKKVFAQIVFQPYLNFNNAHTRFVPAGLILFCNPF